MSRGPGRVERLIYQTLCDHPSEIYTVTDLAVIAYPDVAPETVYHRGYRYREHTLYPKRCRSAILRAAKTAVPRAGWDVMKAEAEGKPPVFFNPCDLHSYARARLRAETFHRPDYWAIEEERFATEPLMIRLLTPETGAWWRHVEERKLRRDGKISEAHVLCEQFEKERQAYRAATVAMFQRLGSSRRG